MVFCRGKLFYLILLLFNVPVSAARPTFNDWARTCMQLPLLKDARVFTQVIEEKEFTDVLADFIIQQTQHLCAASWVTHAPHELGSFFRRPSFACRPFVQRCIVKPQSSVSFHGDLHGDIHSLIKYLTRLHDQGILDNFVITDPDFYLVFLGDYVDRGIYGCEVLYTILRLALANPTRVLLIRGNHEDLGINYGYNFTQEVAAKYTHVTPLLRALHACYSLLPCAVYLGCANSFLQCCHGGMEIGYDSHGLLDAPESAIFYDWIDVLNKKTNALRTECACFNSVIEYLDDMVPQTSFDVGFMWNDFKVAPTKDMLYNPNRGFVYNKDATLATLNAQSTQTNRVYGVIRAHQHSPTLTALMQAILHVDDTGHLISQEKHRQGLGTLWNTHATADSLWYGIVCTLLVSPNIGYATPNGLYPGYTYDTYAMLKTAKNFEDWTLRVFQLY